MDIALEQIRCYRLHVHHLDQAQPAGRLLEAAGVCGLQNSPPGAWETALFFRLNDCSLSALRSALYEEKSLLQAWSYRGAPVVFPTEQSDVFLTALCAKSDEMPWIYTRGVSAALDFLQMPYDDLLRRTQNAAAFLDSHTILSKETLDSTLAALVEQRLPPEKRALWTAPSMYGAPDRQTVGGAVVSFLLRPCSFSSLVVFGSRQKNSPTFTSFENWTGHPPRRRPGQEKTLVRKFLHAYGPADRDALAAWLGCSPQQARRLWNAAADEMVPVSVEGKIRYLLSEDLETLRNAGPGQRRLTLLGAHDPYLDVRDRQVLLPDRALQRAVWKTVANPGVLLREGRVIGTWKTRAQGGKLDVFLSPFMSLSPAEQKTFSLQAEAYASFRNKEIRRCCLE